MDQSPQRKPHRTQLATRGRTGSFPLVHGIIFDWWAPWVCITHPACDRPDEKHRIRPWAQTLTIETGRAPFCERAAPREEAAPSLGLTLEGPRDLRQVLALHLVLVAGFGLTATTVTRTLL